MTDKPDVLLLDELDNARRVVAESRSALTRKLGMLEDRVQETVTEVKQSFDFNHQMQQRPGVMVGGSVLVGYTLARLVSSPRTTTAYRSPIVDAPPLHRPVNGSGTPPSANGFARVKDEVLDVVTGTLWAMAKQAFR